MSQSQEIGGWEKHTKGIGMKLLQKFGFKGRLGANEDGISSAVQVVVRPTNVGLGFGDTVEAPNLPENKKLEAEWKGVEYIEPVTSTKTEDLSGWKKTNFGKKKRKVTYNEESILDAFGDSDVSTPQMIIDMRSSDGKIISSADGLGSSGVGLRQQHVLGQELLYNVGLVSQMQSSAVTAESRQMANTIRRKDGLQQQLAQLQAKKDLESSRIATLNDINSRLTSAQCDSFGSVCSLIKALHTQYPQEFVLFGLLDLVPGFLSSAYRAHPWNIHDNLYFIELMESMLALQTYFEEHVNQDNHQIGLTLSAIYSRCTELEFLPAVRRFITNELTLACSREFILLLGNLRYILTSELFDQLLDSALMPKLVSLTESSSASSATINGVSVLSHLPTWIPLLDKRLRAIFPSVKKLMVKRVNNWTPLLSENQDRELFEDISAWKGTLDAVVLEKVLAENVVSKLLIVLREHWTEIIPSNTCFLMVVRWLDILPTVCMECLLLCEFCPRWLHTLYSMVAAATTSLDHVAVWYMQWKQFFASLPSLRCHCIDALFGVAVQMLKSAVSSWDTIDEPSGVHQFQYLLQAYQSLQYDEMVQLRTTEQLLLKKIESYDEQKEGLKHSIASAVGGSRSSSSGIKDVIESIALERGIVFVPKQGKALVHGRPVWLFGRSQIYFDQRVVFLYKEALAASAAASGSSSSFVSPWVPVSLEELLSEQQQ